MRRVGGKRARFWLNLLVFSQNYLFQLELLTIILSNEFLRVLFSYLRSKPVSASNSDEKNTFGS